MEDFARYRAPSLGLFEGCTTTPSHDTFRRMLSIINPAEVAQCLIDSGRKFLDTLAEKQVVIDGKKLRGVNPHSKGTEGEYLLNAYVGENHLVVGQQQLQNKENEITAIPQILKKLDITNATVSIDAIGTQTDIAKLIVEMMGHYLLAVKENQKSLYEEVTDCLS